MDLESVADEVYALPPGDFTAARDARAAEARKAGDRELAAAIRGFRRPTTSAYAVNLLAQRRAERLVELTEVGERIRAAQLDRAGDEVRRLTERRHEVVAALAAEAAGLAAEAGHPLRDDAVREVTGTLDAALADPDAAEAVRSGRLAVALSYAGMGAVDLSGAVAVPRRSGTRAGERAPAGKAPAGKPAAGKAPAGKAAAEKVAAGKAAPDEAAVQAAAREAAERLAAAEGEVAEAEDGLRQARQRRDEATRRVGAAEQALAEAQQQAAAVTREVRAAERATEAATRRLEAARRHADRAGGGSGRRG